MNQRIDWLSWTPDGQQNVKEGRENEITHRVGGAKSAKTPHTCTFGTFGTGGGVWKNEERADATDAEAPASSPTQDCRTPDRTEGRVALDVLTHAGTRVLLDCLRTIAVPKRNDTPELSRALALLGYGAYTVDHSDRTGRSESLDVVEATLRAAGELVC